MKIQQVVYLFLSLTLFLNTNFAAQTYKETTSQPLDKKIRSILADHYNEFHEQEYFSGIALSVYLPQLPKKNSVKNYYIGSISHEANSPLISEKTVFPIGSISKSFTAALLLNLEKNTKLDLNDSLNKWFPHLEKWSSINIKQLLNMTSGLPNYSDTPMWNSEEYKNLNRRWTEEELIDFAYPHSSYAPPLKHTYFYTNTGYVLAGLIAEKVTHSSLAELFATQLFNKAQLQHTFYLSIDHSSKAQELAHTYNYNQYDNPWLVGTDLYENDLSWAGAAGGILSTSEEVTKWIKALFIDEDILDATQKAKLMSLVSINTGEAISQTSESNTRGFGLGVSQGYMDKIGHYWFYEGQTLGARAIYLYVPCTHIIITAIFNSATNAENDHSHDLLLKLYKILSPLSSETHQCNVKK